MCRVSVNRKKKEKRSILEKWLNKWRMLLKIEHLNYAQLYCRQSMQVVPSESIFFHKYYVAWAYPYSEAEVQRCSVKKVFLKISKNSLENTRARVSLLIKLHAYKVAGLRPVTLLKRRLWHRCFPVNFMEFLRTPFFTEHLWWLLLLIEMVMFFVFSEISVNDIIICC